jgi:hypothetical protein
MLHGGANSVRSLFPLAARESKLMGTVDMLSSPHAYLIRHPSRHFAQLSPSTSRRKRGEVHLAARTQTTIAIRACLQ